MANGDDLSPIEFQAPVQQGPSGAAAIESAISDVGTIFGNARTEKILKNSREEMQDDVQEVADETDQDPVLDIPEGDTSNVEKVRNNLRRLQFAINQGNSSQRARAELEMRRTLNAAQAQHPGLRGELAREFSSLTATDATLDELGMRDVQSRSFSKEAAADLATIKAEAYGDVENGGLGMDPATLSVSDPLFAPIYLNRKHLRAIKEDTLLTLNAKAARRDANADEYADIYAQTLSGQNRATSLILERTRATTAKVARALRDPSSTRNAQVIQDWDLFGRQQAVEEVEVAISVIEEDFASVPVTVRSGERYEEMRAWKDDTIAGLERYRDAVLSDNTSLIKAYESEDQIRQIAVREQFPRIAELNRFLGESRLLIENWETLGGEDVIVQHKLGKIVQEGFEGAMTRLYSLGGTDQLDPDASVEDINGALDRQQNLNSQPYGHAAVDDAATLKSAVAVFEAHFDEVQPFITENSNPEIVGRNLSLMRNTIKDISDIGRPPVDAIDSITSRLAQGSLVTAVQRAREGSTKDGNTAVSLGQQAETFMDRRTGGDSARTQGYENSIQNGLGSGVALGDVIIFDGAQVEKDGTISFKIDDAAVLRALKENNRSIGKGQFGAVQIRKRNVKNAAEEQARMLGDRMTEDLRAFAHIIFMKQGLAKPDYLDAFDRARFSAVFPDVVETPEE